MKGNKTLKKILLVIMALAVFLTPITVLAETHCTNNNNHSILVGNMGRWFDNRDKLISYYQGVVDEWNNKVNSGEF